MQVAIDLVLLTSSAENASSSDVNNAIHVIEDVITANTSQEVGTGYFFLICYSYRN